MNLTDIDTRSCLLVLVGFVHTSVPSLIPEESDFICLPSQMAAASWPRPWVSNPCLKPSHTGLHEALVGRRG